VVAWIAIAGFFGVLYFFVSAALKNSEAYKMAVTQLLANSEAINALGTPISTGTPSGKIETSGPTGKADLSFSVEGPKAKGTVNLDATKDLGVWKLNRIELQIDGRAGRINLAEGAARACRRTTPKRCSGSAKPPSKASPTPRTLSAAYTTRAAACRRTMPKQ
jgi:hypothetical protein